MTTTIWAKHEPYDDGRLGEVGLDMDHAGAPTLRCLKVGNDLCAIEGSHRLALAHSRGLIPKIILLEPDLPGKAHKPSGLPKYEFPYVLILRERDFWQTLEL